MRVLEHAFTLSKAESRCADLCYRYANHLGYCLSGKNEQSINHWKIEISSYIHSIVSITLKSTNKKIPLNKARLWFFNQSIVESFDLRELCKLAVVSKNINSFFPEKVSDSSWEKLFDLYNSFVEMLMTSTEEMTRTKVSEKVNQFLDEAYKILSEGYAR